MTLKPIAILGLFLCVLSPSEAKERRSPLKTQARAIETLDVLGGRNARWQAYEGLRFEFEGDPTVSKHLLKGRGFETTSHVLRVPRCRIVNRTPDRVAVQVSRTVIWAPGQKGSESVYLSRLIEGKVPKGKGALVETFLKSGEATPWMTLGNVPYARVVKDLPWPNKPDLRASAAIMFRVTWKDIRTFTQGRPARALLSRLVNLR